MRPLVLLLAVTSHFSLLCQDSLVFRLGVQIVPRNSVTPQYLGNNAVFRGISPSVSWIGKSRKYENELGAQFYWRNTGDKAIPDFTREWESALTYDVRANKVTDKDLLFFVGYGARAFYYRGVAQDLSFSGYQRRSWNSGISVAVKPILRFPVQSRTFFELMFEFLEMSFSAQGRYYDNPNLTERQRKSGDLLLDLNAFGRLYLRLGLRL